MLQLIAEGRPLTDGMTTQQLMMTTALKELYAFLDVWEVDDDGKVTDRFKQANPQASRSPSRPPQGRSRSPTRSIRRARTTCTGTTPTSRPTTRPSPAARRIRSSSRRARITLHYLLYGSLDGRKTSAGVQLPARRAARATAPQLTPATSPTGRMVTIRPPKAGEATTPFYDLPSLRTANELVLDDPARRLLQHAGVLRELADQHQQPDARHA